MKRSAYKTLGQLYAAYHEVNQSRFGMLLPMLPIFINPGVRKRQNSEEPEIAHLWTDDYTGAPRYIEFWEHHALTDHWSYVRETLLHEVIHVWQAATGRKVAHDAVFRLMAKRLGVSGRACD